MTLLSHPARLARLVVPGVAALAVLLLSSAAAPASAATIDAPERVKPGRMITIKLAGFPAGTRIAVQFGLDNGANCCVSKVHRPRGEDGYLIPASGRRTLRVRMPRSYARCVAVRCDSPGWTRYRKGDRLYALAFDSTHSDSDLYVRDRVRVG